MCGHSSSHPCLGQVHDGAVVEDIAIVGSGCRSRDGASAFAFGIAWFERERGVLEAYVIATADEVHSAVDVAILEVALHSIVLTVVGILIGEYLDIAEDGAVATVLPYGGTSGSPCAIVVERVFQRKILEIEILPGVEKQISFAETFDGGIRCGDDDGAVGVLSDE